MYDNKGSNQLYNDLMLDSNAEESLTYARNYNGEGHQSDEDSEGLESYNDVDSERTSVSGGEAEDLAENYNV